MHDQDCDRCRSWHDAEQELLEHGLLGQRAIAIAGARAMILAGDYELLGTTPAGVYFLHD